MGCDFGQVLVIGVKLKSVNELFEDVTYEEYGCEHKVSGTKFCPECGRLAMVKGTRSEAKIPFDMEDWRYNDKPCIAGKFYVECDEEEHRNEVFIGVYKKMEYNPGSSVSVSYNDQILLMKTVIEELLPFLNEHGVEYDSESVGIHMIPYLSC